MGHQMDSSFFASKRPWSRYKDYLLESYLEPYIPKVNQLRKPILLVDCFAGCGVFEDGSPGSPLIIAKAVQRWRAMDMPVSARCIEADPSNFEKLKKALAPHRRYVDAALGTFEETLPELERAAKQNTVFLYVDPYSVKGLQFDRMQRVFDQIQSSGSSVEVLMNFNVAIFMRWALAAVKRLEGSPSDDDIETFADNPKESVERDVLSGIAGGDYWIEIATDQQLSFQEKLKSVSDEYVKRLLGSFNYVARYVVKERYRHSTPKYEMVFATRHSEGVRLMNDFMCQAHRKFLQSEFNDSTLFDLTPASEEVVEADLHHAIIQVISEATSQPTRPEIQLKLFSMGYFARLKVGDINRAIADLVRSKSILPFPAKKQVNDTTTFTISNAPKPQSLF